MFILRALGAFLAFSLVLGLSLWLFFERSLLPRAATRKFFTTPGMTVSQKIEGYVYLVRPDLYLKPGKWPWFVRFFEGSDANEYHGKVMTQNDAARLIQVDRPVNARNLEHVIPYQAARKLILQGNPAIAVLECPCRVQKYDACKPLDVCMVVGEPFVSFLLEHRTGKARRVSAKEAALILQAEEDRGHIHTAWFRTIMNDRFYTICNCCKCCCLGMDSYRRGVPRIAHSGYRPIVDQQRCVQCGVCAETCIFGAITLEAGRPILDDAACMGCGLCASHCPVSCITLDLAPDRGIPLDVGQMP